MFWFSLYVITGRQQSHKTWAVTINVTVLHRHHGPPYRCREASAATLPTAFQPLSAVVHAFSGNRIPASRCLACCAFGCRSRPENGKRLFRFPSGKSATTKAMSTWLAIIERKNSKPNAERKLWVVSIFYCSLRRITCWPSQSIRLLWLSLVQHEQCLEEQLYLNKNSIAALSI